MKLPVFFLENESVKLVKFAPKSVLHGEERGSLADLELEFTTDTGVLAHFAPTLRAHFYKKSSDVDELVKKDDILTALRYPQIEKIDWDHKQVGSTFSVHRGISDLTLTECEVDGFRLVMQEGGVVVVEFRIRARPSGDQAGILYDLIQTELEVSLSPPAQKELDV